MAWLCVNDDDDEDAHGALVGGIADEAVDWSVVEDFWDAQGAVAPLKLAAPGATGRICLASEMLGLICVGSFSGMEDLWTVGGGAVASGSMVH